MPVRLDPYLSFKDNARQAMEFYRSIFGGKLTISTFEEFHASEDPNEDHKVMHAALEGDHDIVFMAADTPNAMGYQPGANISMSLSGDDEALLTSWYDKLSDGGTIVMPLGKAPWGDIFGMCVDRFGINWMVNVTRQ